MSTRDLFQIFCFVSDGKALETSLLHLVNYFRKELLQARCTPQAYAIPDHTYPPPSAGVGGYYGGLQRRRPSSCGGKITVEQKIQLNDYNGGSRLTTNIRFGHPKPTGVGLTAWPPVSFATTAPQARQFGPWNGVRHLAHTGDGGGGPGGVVVLRSRPLLRIPKDQGLY